MRFPQAPSMTHEPEQVVEGHDDVALTEDNIQSHEKDLGRHISSVE